MIDGMYPPGQEDRYNVPRDVRRHIEARAKRIADGLELSEDQKRQGGGVVISALATVLLEHVLRSHMRVVDEQSISEAQSCARRIIEYLGALEAVALHPYSIEEEDTPQQMLGLAAVTLETLARDFSAMPVLSDTAKRGLETFQFVAQRLRVTEGNIDRVAQMNGAPPSMPAALPDVVDGA